MQSYKISSLKKRLKKEHQKLVFLRPSRRNCSELVFVDSIGVDVIEEKVSLEQDFSSISTSTDDKADEIQIP